MAKRISVVNFKGGVGKTTLAFHLGCWISRGGDKAPRVLLVDVDHQSSLSIVCMTPNAWESRCQTGTTINQIFVSYMTPGTAMPGADIIVKQPLFGRSANGLYPNLDLIPAQMELDDTEIDLASTTIGNPILSDWTKRTLFCRWLTDSGVDDAYDYIIFDCPPATKLVSQNALAASHAYILPVIPDAVSTRGVTHLRNLLRDRIDARLKALAAAVPASKHPPTYVPDTAFGGIIISMARPHGPAKSGYINEHSQYMDTLRRLYGSDVLTNQIDYLAGVPESIGYGWPVFNQNWNPNVSQRDLPQMFGAVCQELMNRLP